MAKIRIDQFSIDKKLNINYNSVGMHISCSLDVPVDSIKEATEVVERARSVLESLLDGMIVESASGLQKLQQTASKHK